MLHLCCWLAAHTVAIMTALVASLLSIWSLAEEEAEKLDDQYADLRQTTLRDRNDAVGATAWQNANTNLNFNKTLQWNYIYYVLLLFAAIVALNDRRDIADPARLLLTVTACLVFHVGLYLSVKIQFDIRRERLSVIATQLAFTTTMSGTNLRRLLGEAKAARSFLSRPYITLTVLVTIFVGFAVTETLIVHHLVSSILVHW